MNHFSLFTGDRLTSLLFLAALRKGRMTERAKLVKEARG